MIEATKSNKKLIFERTAIMGILNVTPDSFSDGGLFSSCKAALTHCEQMICEGADIIDIGACSTRPNSNIASAEEEAQRLLPIMKAIRREFPNLIISIDTFRKNIAQECINEGANIINDISGGLFDDEMLNFVAKNNVTYVMSHLCGTPDTMHNFKIEDNVCNTVAAFFEQQLKKIDLAGATQVILDPGIGFSKSLKANYTLLNNIEKYRVRELPILIGISRKSLINKILNTTPDSSENGTTVLNTIAMLQGANIIRCHNVKNAVETRCLVEECQKTVTLPKN